MPKEDKGKVKMTVIQFETESDNATLQENIRAITNTLARALAPQPRVIQAPPQLPNGNGDNGANGDAKSSEQPSLFDDNDDAIDGEITPAPAKAKAKSSSPRQLPTPQTLDLDLKSGDVPLKEFLEQKKPSGDNKRYLAIAYWLKTYLSINAITMNHAYTCYRFMGWNVPADASSPLRAMKKQGWMKKAEEAGAYSINHVGENVINEMGGQN
jgi:hypothetical protein